MIGLFFLFLGIVSAKLAIWQSGLLAGILKTAHPTDYTLAAFSLTAAIIFFGLSLTGRTNTEKLASRSLSD